MKARIIIASLLFTAAYAALYAKPHAMHDAFEQFGAFSQDAVDNKALLAQGGKLTMPVLGVGGEKSFGTGMADELRFVASNVVSGIVPHSGHWIMEENPQATVKIVTEFLAKKKRVSPHCQGGSRSRLHHRERPDRHHLREVTPDWSPCRGESSNRCRRRGQRRVRRSGARPCGGSPRRRRRS